MCFSPEADLVAGALIGAVAVDVWRHHPAPRDRALAAVPVVFAVHSLVESLVWFGGRGDVAAGVGSAATYVYLVIAYALPTLVPYAVGAREPDPRRRRRLRALTVVGAATTALLLWELVDGPVTADLQDRYVAYRDGGIWTEVVVPAYVLATCGATLLASSRGLQAFGVANVAVVGLLVWVNAEALTSLWCAWAALTSIGIALVVRRAARTRSVLAPAPLA